MIDMNRWAEQLAQINQATPKVALLYSRPAAFWDQRYGPSIRAAHTAMMFMGQPVTFVSERQLASGNLSTANADVDWIIVPSATHVFETTAVALEKFAEGTGHVILLGGDSLSRDEYDLPRQLPEGLRSVPRLESPVDEREMMKALKPALLSSGLKLMRLRADDDSEAWGIEYRLVPSHGAMLFPIVNLNDKRVICKIDLTGAATDLLSGTAVQLNHIVLDSMRPMLLRIQNQGDADQ